MGVAQRSFTAVYEDASPTINTPAGTVAEDYLVMVFAELSNRGATTAPDGWTFLGRWENGTTTSEAALELYGRTAGSIPASQTWTANADTNYVAWHLLCFSGVDLAAPFAVSPTVTASDATSVTSKTSPSVAGPVGGLVVQGWHWWASGGTITPPGGLGGLVVSGPTNGQLATGTRAADGTDGGETASFSASDDAQAFTFVLAVDGPTVDAGPDASVARGANANLVGTASGTGTLSYQWAKDSGPGTLTFGTPTAKDTTVSTPTEGTYVVRLTVTDDNGTSSDTMTLTVLAPTVEAGPEVVVAPDVLGTLDGTVTWPGTVGTVAWSGPVEVVITNATSVDTTAKSATVGTYTLTLTATDSVGPVSDTMTFRVNVAPVVDAGGPYTGKGGVPTQLTGSATDADPLTYAWSADPPLVSFSDPTALSPTATADPGSYTLSLAADDGFYQVTDTAALEVSNPPIMLKMTAVAAGDIEAQTSVHVHGVLAGETYAASAGFRHGGTSRPCRVVLDFYALSGNLLSTVQGADVLDGSTLTTASVTAVAPPLATSAKIRLRVLGCAAGEVHRADAVSMTGLVGNPEPTRQRAVFDFGTSQPGAGFQVSFPTLRGVAVRSVTAVTQPQGDRPRR